MAWRHPQIEWDVREPATHDLVGLAAEASKSTSALVASPEPRAVAGKGFACHAVHAILVGLSRPGSPRVRNRQAAHTYVARHWNGNSLGRLRMRIIKVVLLLGVVIAIAVWMLMYFSPYNSCIREGWSQEICERGKDQPN